MPKKTLELTPLEGEMLKPKELIDLQGTGHLTIQDRRVFNKLIENAWGPELGKPDVWFEIGTGELRDTTSYNSRLQDSIERLMKTIVVAIDPIAQKEKRTALLSSNELDTGVNSGVLRYRITPELSNLLKDSTIFAKLDLEVMKGFRSKYAFSLYEAIARCAKMKHKFLEELSIEDLRNILGVENGKLEAYKNLNSFAIKPAVEEVNAITPYQVSILPVKQGKKVVAFKMGWNVKSQDGLKEAYQELNRHSIGRSPRTKKTTDVIDS